MALEMTFGIIKPNAVQDRHIGEILTAIEQAGFTLRGMKLTTLSSPVVRGFYREHLAKPFFPDLETFMTEGPVVLLALEAEDAIRRWRELMGVTDSDKAAPGTLRRRFGMGITRNAVHGSDSQANAEAEIHHFFNAFELV
nr:nucleoside-diphosphate kinase [uncultured Holophaga sp.]